MVFALRYNADIRKREFYIWEGICDSFPGGDPIEAFDSERWVNSLRTFGKGKSQLSVSGLSLVHEYPLAPVVGIEIGTSGKPIRILDFGGGLGESFFRLTACLPAPSVVEFHIVETPSICQRGREEYEGCHSLFFHEELPQETERFDIIHSAAALHYISDWRALLKKLASFQPRIMMLFGLTAGDIKTFVTFQNYYGTKIPVWFWNLEEFLEVLTNLGYKLVYKSLAASHYLGKIQPLPMDNFPPKYRLKRKCNLIFLQNDCVQRQEGDA